MSTDLKEYFKLYLDPEYHDEYQHLTHADAKRYYRDYLTCIHNHIVQWFVNRFPQWTAQCVEWVFSVPTTWRNPGTIHTLESLIRAAGFGQDGSKHSCKITLTEAEAAAICVSKQNLEVWFSSKPALREALTLFSQRDDVVIVCDAGGGTTVSQTRAFVDDVARLMWSRM
jgi:hypothetical protein